MFRMTPPIWGITFHQYGFGRTSALPSAFAAFLAAAHPCRLPSPSLHRVATPLACCSSCSLCRLAASDAKPSI